MTGGCFTTLAFSLRLFTVTIEDGHLSILFAIGFAGVLTDPFKTRKVELPCFTGTYLGLISARLDLPTAGAI